MPLEHQTELVDVHPIYDNWDSTEDISNIILDNEISANNKWVSNMKTAILFSCCLGCALIVILGLVQYEIINNIG